jgi:hypothetical protein
MGAVGATVELVVAFNPMPDYATSTVEAGRRKCLNRAFEAVKRIALPFHNNIKAFVVIILAYLADPHDVSSLKFFRQGIFPCASSQRT